MGSRYSRRLVSSSFSVQISRLYEPSGRKALGQDPNTADFVQLSRTGGLKSGVTEDFGDLRAGRPYRQNEVLESFPQDLEFVLPFGVDYRLGQSYTLPVSNIFPPHFATGLWPSWRAPNRNKFSSSSSGFKRVRSG